jgi:hypothetical protein
VINAHSVPAASKDDVIPRGLRANVYIVDVASYVKAGSGTDGDDVVPEPKFIELDIWIDKKHVYRLTNVAVSRLYIAKMLGHACYWTLVLDMTDGFTVDTPKGPFTLRRTHWCWKDQ